MLITFACLLACLQAVKDADHVVALVVVMMIMIMMEMKLIPCV